MKKKLEYHHNLYLSESISEEKLDKLKKRLQRQPLLCNVYLLAISRNPMDQLEILSAGQLVQKYYEEYPLSVVGIASDYDEAVKIVEQIVQECLQSRGDCALKNYLVCKERMQ